MSGHDTLALTAVVAVCAYYLIAWLLYGRDRKTGVLIAAYEPPRDLSPALLRYIWKKEFDDRTFWAGILSLVAKGIATMHGEDGSTRLRSTRVASLERELPDEERLLAERFIDNVRKGTVINMLDPKTALAVTDMAHSLRQSAVGRWFLENRRFVVVGASLSMIALLAVAQPHSLEQFGVLVFTLAVMAPAAFYLFFLTLRARDLYCALRQNFDAAILRRAAMILAFIVCCMAGITLGGIILGNVFGWPFLIVTFFLAILNMLEVQWMKAPTREGQTLLAEIEGFRHFLTSVERFPMQRSEAPSDGVGLYEKYLPYAVALEVEQAWCDRFVALASTFHENAGMPGAESLYLGMWDGKPLEIIYRPRSAKG